jgi:hypothetical protein
MLKSVPKIMARLNMHIFKHQCQTPRCNRTHTHTTHLVAPDHFQLLSCSLHLLLARLPIRQSAQQPPCMFNHMHACCCMPIKEKSSLHPMFILSRLLYGVLILCLLLCCHHWCDVPVRSPHLDVETCQKEVL